ncbi:hypothetical protein B0T20DRAFT_366146 [Sordaria brevicollis]|uniref:CBM1 domain-containing protein n=1 Tax=Sordaria brevicollis TaxID=83679 RepID=A0AAE0U0B0_SORBR|nr:hypothetical protein B0T20DRAFT_366146 [Sordaria brevicollis]
MRVLASIPILAAVASAQGSAWSQCGGMGWAGPTSCVSGYVCTKLNDYYSQCVPGTTTYVPGCSPAPLWKRDPQGRPIVQPRATCPGLTTSTSSSSAAPVTTTLRTSTVPTSIGTTYDNSPGVPSATAVPSNPNPTVLEPGWYWIRAVAAPNFHKYLQGGSSSATSSNQTALLESHTTAGQFSIIDGQLVFNTKPSQLYLNVENPADKTQRKLKTWFSTTKNAYGTFKFQGDTLTWTVADIKRPNEAAWLVCTGQEVFINTGAYLYQTPAGCADQTIHYYSGSTADL